MPETIFCTQIEGIFVGLGVLAVTPRQNGEGPRPGLGAVTEVLRTKAMQRRKALFWLCLRMLSIMEGKSRRQSMKGGVLTLHLQTVQRDEC